MEQAHLLKVLSDLGAKNVKFRERSGRFHISCLLSPWLHEGGDDSTPSCFISTKHEISLVHCFGCGYSSTLLQYVSAYNAYKEGKFDGLLDTIKYLERKDPNAQIDAYVRKWEEKFARSAAVQDQLEIWDEEELTIFKKELRPSFLATKGISKEIAEEFGLLWDEKFGRIVVHIRRSDGGLVGCVGRHWCIKCYKKEPHEVEARYYNYWSFPKSRFLFNENLLNPQGAVLVVEGIFDVLKLVSIGIRNTVALLGSDLSDDQARKLKGMAQPVYIMLDGDASGKSGTLRAISKLKGKTPGLYECRVPDGRDPGDMSFKELIDALKSAGFVI